MLLGTGCLDFVVFYMLMLLTLPSWPVVDGRKLTIQVKIHDKLLSVSNRVTVTMKLQTF